MEGTCVFAFKDEWTDREINSAEADFLSVPGICMRNRAPIGSERQTEGER